MRRIGSIAAGLAALGLMAGGASAAPTAHRVAHHHRHGAHGRPRTAVRAPAYGPTVDPTPTCRYADGTPYDPDIIGGANHVGAGGPAVNLGGFDPCGY